MIEIESRTLGSRLTRREIPYRVILPKGYHRTSKNYPVLYLLHGLFGSCENWLELTGITDYAGKYDFLIVLVEGGDNWYTDSATVAEDRYESYFIGELIPEIDRLYKTIDKKKRRAVAGLSMGGYGALKFALKYPDLFILAASMSGAFDAPHRTAENPGDDWETLGSSILRVFGTENSVVRSKNDLFRLIGRSSAKDLFNLPFLLIECGTGDEFLSTNRKLAALLKEKKIAHRYKEFTGGHDWDYWDQGIRRILAEVEIIFYL